MPAESGSIDTTNLLQVCRSGDAVDVTLLRELLGYFVDANRDRMQEAARAAGVESRAELRDIAHAVRGSAALLGARRLEDLARVIERDALTSDAGCLSTAVAALQAEFSAVLTTIQQRHPEAC